MLDLSTPHNMLCIYCIVQLPSAKVKAYSTTTRYMTTKISNVSEVLGMGRSSDNSP